MALQILRGLITSFIVSILGTLSILWSVFESEIKAATTIAFEDKDAEVDSGLYRPASAIDAYKVHLLLTKRLNLPAELSLQIIDQASYYLRFAATRTDSSAYTSHRLNHDTDPYISLAVPGPPSCNALGGSALSSRLRRIRIIIRSHDQGWSSFPADHGTYENSWTWFNVSIVRSSDTSTSIAEPNYLVETEPATPVTPTSPIWQPRAATMPDREAVTETTDVEVVRWERLVVNRHGIGDAIEHVVEFGRDLDITPGQVEEDGEISVEETPKFFPLDTGNSLINDSLELVDQRQVIHHQHSPRNPIAMREIMAGDEICVWPRALYPGWTNHVEAARVEVYVSVF